MTLNDSEIIKKLKIERDYLEAKLHKVNKALEAFGASNNSARVVSRVYKDLKTNCKKCGREISTRRILKAGNYCIVHRPGIERLAQTQIEKTKTSKPSTLLKGDALSH